MLGSLYVDCHELLAIIMTGLWSFSTFPRDRVMSLLGHISVDMRMLCFSYCIYPDCGWLLIKFFKATGRRLFEARD